MNWGHKLTIFIILFMGLILTMVVLSTQQKIELVHDNYYDQEIKYQDQIDRIRNLKALEYDVQARLDGDKLIIQFPKDLIGQRIEGELHFFKPSNASEDKLLPIETDLELIQKINRVEIGHGFYRLKIQWTSDGLEYYAEKTVNL
jgi:hypothetical protein